VRGSNPASQEKGEDEEEGEEFLYKKCQGERTTGYQLEGRRNRFQLSALATFLYFPKCLDIIWGPPSLSNRYRRLLCRG
jgi:hypothetical protein